jgi:hypothetical protein
MDILLTVLALVGVAAAVWHVVRAAFRFLGHGAAGMWADEVARNHARRGDVTGVEDSRRQREAVKRRKTRAGAEAVGWLILLLVPPLTPWGRHIYAAYTLLWLVPALRGRKP